MVDDLWWRDKDAEYIRHRSDRYPGAMNIEPDWTLEAAVDPRRAAEVCAVRQEYAEEEAEAAEVEAAENAAALEVALSLRITRELDVALKRRAAQEQISPSALVRRLLRHALHGSNEPVLTAQQVGEIARRVMRESA